MQADIRESMLHTLCKIKNLAPNDISDHFEEPLSGTYFRFDVVDMAYVILELKKRFPARNPAWPLRECYYWSPSQFSEFLCSTV